MDPFNDSVSDPQAELAQTRRELEKLKTETLLQRDEIRALKAEARSFQGEIQSLNSKVQTLEERTLQSTPALTIGRDRDFCTATSDDAPPQRLPGKCACSQILSLISVLEPLRIFLFLKLRYLCSQKKSPSKSKVRSATSAAGFLKPVKMMNTRAEGIFRLLLRYMNRQVYEDKTQFGALGENFCFLDGLAPGAFLIGLGDG